MHEGMKGVAPIAEVERCGGTAEVGLEFDIVDMSQIVERREGVEVPARFRARVTSVGEDNCEYVVLRQLR